MKLISIGHSIRQKRDANTVTSLFKIMSWNKDVPISYILTYLRVYMNIPANYDDNAFDRPVLIYALSLKIWVILNLEQKCNETAIK